MGFPLCRNWHPPGPHPRSEDRGEGGNRRDGSTKGYTDRARLRKGTELERRTGVTVRQRLPLRLRAAAHAARIAAMSSVSVSYLVRISVRISRTSWTRTVRSAD